MICWNNSDKEVVGIPCELEPIPDTARVAKNLGLARAGPTGKANTIALLKKCSNVMISNDICYSHRSVSSWAIIRETVLLQ